MEIVSLGFMCNDIIFILKKPERIKKELEYYYKKYPLHSWLAQKKYYFGW